MKNIKIAGIAALAASLLVGCANNPQGETNGASYVESSTSSVESSSSSSESSSSSTVESSVDMGDGNTDDIAVIVTDNQDIIKSNQLSQGDSSSNSDTSTDVSTSEPTMSEPTSSISSSSEPTSSSSNSTPNTSKPTSSSSQPTTSKPTSSSSSSGGNTSTHTSPYWNPDAPGNKPGPYGGYYDANGALHCKDADMPRDSYGAPVKSFWTEDGRHILTKAEKEAYDAETERIDNGGLPDTSGLDWSEWGFKF